ncbi:hypothetical protein C405_14598 [Stenotrophomonas maltophilia AU12-09]|uniref:hypothetical protein n=1 Tax=Stenotrophomonas maltophilia TaxID=40324 RepID=UPI0002BDC1B5|nr:hypothetical protein [Stenotrophomonas maltophilia]EMI48761.1 hypothetical protein C405_14598 [Stenotrophomonas maltophilia AU12-09]
MTGPIDVLAVMGRAIELVARPHTEGFHEARSAISELIAKGDRLTKAFRALGLDNSLVNRSQLARECEEALVTFDAALARVKGGAA